MVKEIVLFLLYIIVALTSGKQIEDHKSRLILEFDWPEPKKNVLRYPHTASCSHFYVMRPGKGQFLKKCPNDELFDYRTVSCRPKTEAKCWSDLLKKSFSKKKANHFKCPFPWGSYPDTEDCTLFYDCLRGVPYVRKCPDNFLFDKAERTCVEAKEAMCADHKDVVEPGYRCPYKWGIFTHSKDCSKYYECLKKIPSIRTCKKNMLFDNFKRRCMPVDDVECGKRFNPYGRSRETTQLNTTVLVWKTTNRYSSRPTTITNDISTGHPSESTNHFSTGLPAKTTNGVFTGHPSKSTNHFSTGSPTETTNDISTGRSLESTNHFSTGLPAKTTNGVSTERTLESTNHFFTRLPAKTTNGVSTERTLESTNHFSTGLPAKTTNNISSGRPSESTNHFSTGLPAETTNGVSTGRPWESTNHISTGRTSKQ